MNLIQVENMLKGLPDQALAKEMQTPTGAAPPYMVMSEMQRRQTMRQTAAQPGQQNQDTIANNLIKNLAAPQQGAETPKNPSTPMGPPSAQPQGPTQGYARGGSVSGLPFDTSNYVTGVKSLEQDKRGYGSYNDYSGAFGAYQFLPSTWEKLRQQHPELHLPSAASSEDSIPDQHIQDVAYTQAFLPDQAKALQRLGVDITPANMYLAHKYGPKGAAELLNADPGQSMSSWARSVYGDKTGQRVVRGNNLRGMKVQDEVSRINKHFGIGGAPAQPSPLDSVDRSQIWSPPAYGDQSVPTDNGNIQFPDGPLYNQPGMAPHMQAQPGPSQADILKQIDEASAASPSLPQFQGFDDGGTVTAQQRYLDAVNKARAGVGLQPLKSLSDGSPMPEGLMQAGEKIGNYGLSQMGSQNMLNYNTYPYHGTRAGAVPDYAWRAIVGGPQWLAGAAEAGLGGLTGSIGGAMGGVRDAAKWAFTDPEQQQPSPTPQAATQASPAFTQGGMGGLSGVTLGLGQDEPAPAPAAPVGGGDGADMGSPIDASSIPESDDVSRMLGIVDRLNKARPAADPRLAAYYDHLEKMTGNQDEARRENANMALVKAGLAMMAAKTGNLGQAIGEGGLAGIDAYDKGLNDMRDEQFKALALQGDFLKTNAEMDTRSFDTNVAAAAQMYGSEQRAEATRSAAIARMGSAQYEVYRKLSPELQDGVKRGMARVDAMFGDYMNPQTGMMMPPQDQRIVDLKNRAEQGDQKAAEMLDRWRQMEVKKVFLNMGIDPSTYTGFELHSARNSDYGTSQSSDLE